MLPPIPTIPSPDSVIFAGEKKNEYAKLRKMGEIGEIGHTEDMEDRA